MIVLPSLAVEDDSRLNLNVLLVNVLLYGLYFVLECGLTGYGLHFEMV